MISVDGVRQAVRRLPGSRFARDAYSELRKAQWPTPQQTSRLTGLVVLISLLMAIVLGLADLAFDRLFGLVT